MSLPDPPPTPRSLDREPEPERDAPALIGALLTVSALIAVAAVTFVWLRAEPAQTADTLPSAAPAARVNPCDGETFDANGCAVRMIQGASKETGVPPYTVVSVWCSKWSTPEAKRAIVDKWVSQGAPSRAKARAVLNQILDYCPGMEEA